MIKFDERLRNLRKEKGVTQREIAEFLGIKTRPYQNYESGDRRPDYEKLVALADYFGVSTDYLLGRTPPEPGLDLTGLTEEQRAAVEVIVRGMRRQNDADFPGK